MTKLERCKFITCALYGYEKVHTDNWFIQALMKQTEKKLMKSYNLAGMLDVIRRQLDREIDKFI